MKKLSTPFAIFTLGLLMVFGIEINSAQAIVPVQQASNAEQYREADQATASEIHIDSPKQQGTLSPDNSSEIKTFANEHDKVETDNKNNTKEGTEHSETPSSDEAETGVVGMFGLNWKLLLAQLINFGIVVFVLWKFAWKPITTGLTERTKKIEDSLAEARKIAEDRQTFDSWKNAEMSQVKKTAQEIITKAKADAEQIQSQTLEQTKLEQQQIISQTQETLQQEKTSILNSAKNEIADLIVLATEKIIQTKLDSNKDQQIIAETLKSMTNKQE